MSLGQRQGHNNFSFLLVTCVACNVVSLVVLTYLIVRAVFVRFSLEGQSFDWRLATITGKEVAKLVPWN